MSCSLATAALGCTIALLCASLGVTLCPDSCYCDEHGEYASCVGDGHRGLPNDLPTAVLRVELRNYVVPELGPSAVKGLVSLREFRLQQSKVETVDNETFSLCTNLERLDLSQNAIVELSPPIFKNLQSLRYLDLSSNSIEVLEEAFTDLLVLEQLNLRVNQLSQLTTHSFVGLHKVQYLNLDSNNISEIEIGTFQYLTNLAHLIISNNPLTTLSRLDFFGSRLQYIDISNVGLNQVPQSLTKFVRDLRLAKNNITSINAGDFDSYPYLGLLVLDDNCVGEIENDALGRQDYLIRLWLNGNCLTSVPSNLPSSLLALYIEENRLTELRSYSFKGLVNLEQLFLQRNEIKLLFPCAFCGLINLKSLDLQANQIENLTQNIFSNLTQLESLDISQNKLKIIDARAFESLSKLITLQMSRVHTTVSVSDYIFDPLHSLQTLEVYDSPLLINYLLNSTRIMHGLGHIHELNIMHNKIVRLRGDFASFMPSIKIIKISGNNWHCDRSIQWLANWIKQSDVHFYSSYNVRCASPPSVQFKPLMMLTEEDFEGSEVTVQPLESLSLRVESTSATTSIEISSISSDVASVNKSPSGLTSHKNISHTATTSKSQSPPLNLPHSIEEDATHTSTVGSVVQRGVEHSSFKRNVLQHPPGPFHESLNITAFAMRSNPQSLPSDVSLSAERDLFILAALAGCCALLGAFLLARRSPYRPVERRGSISYCPHKDEVSIVSEGTVGTQTNSHCGLGNKLYYIMEDNVVEQDCEKEPESSRQGFLTDSPERLY